MMVIGLTGGIASGKSLATTYLRELEIPVIDTDEIARQVVTPGQPAWHALRDHFGPDYFLPDGQLDRAKLGRRVFADAGARQTLEAITHPAIFAEVDRRLARLRQRPDPPALVVVAVPLLFEVGAESHFDAIVFVDAHPQQQHERLVRLRGLSPDDADARIAAQLPRAVKRARAHYVLDNTGTPETLRRQVVELVRRLCASARKD